MGHSKSARIGIYSKFQKHSHDGSVSGSWPIMNILLKFKVRADSSTFGMSHYATSHYQMGFFKMGFAENLGHSFLLKIAKIRVVVSFKNLESFQRQVFLIIHIRGNIYWCSGHRSAKKYLGKFVDFAFRSLKFSGIEHE